jgi:hypothetical protein
VCARLQFQFQLKATPLGQIPSKDLHRIRADLNLQ